MKTQLALSIYLFILLADWVLCDPQLHFLRDNKNWSPAPHTLAADRPRRQNIVLIAGHLRSFEYTKPSIAKHLLEFYDADVGICMTTVSHSNHDEGRTVNATMAWNTKLISGWAEDRVIFKEFLPDFAIHNTSTNYATHEHLPLHVDHVCPTGCSRSGRTPRDLPVSLLNPPHFPRTKGLTDNYEQSMFSQLYAWYSCFQLLSTYEALANHTYTMVIRHRSDAALWADYPVVPSSVVPNGVIYIPEGDDYNGVNDRMWISDRTAASVAFNTLLLPFLRMGADMYCGAYDYIHSPESNLLDHLKIHKITIDRSLKWSWSRIDPKSGCIRMNSNKLNTTICLKSEVSGPR